MICLYVSGVFYRCLWRVYEAYLVGRKHEFVFQESCIDRYQLALDRLIVAKSSSRFPVCNTFPAAMLESDTSVGVEHHEKAEANIIVPGLPYTKLSILPTPDHTSRIQPPNPITTLLLLHFRTSTHLPTSTTTPPCQLPRTLFTTRVLATHARICAGTCPSLRPAFSPLARPRAPRGNVGACFLPCCLN